MTYRTFLTMVAGCVLLAGPAVAADEAPAPVADNSAQVVAAVPPGAAVAESSGQAVAAVPPAAPAAEDPAPAVAAIPPDAPAAGSSGQAVAAIPPSPLQPDAQPVYTGAGKRDPFRPFTLDIRPPRDVNRPQTPLQQFELGQLKVAGVVAGMSPPRAMVEDSGGMGYIVTIGTPIGRNEGVVKMIEPGRIVVEERAYDFYGQEQLSTVVMVVPSEDGGDARP